MIIIVISNQMLIIENQTKSIEKFQSYRNFTNKMNKAGLAALVVFIVVLISGQEVTCSDTGTGRIGNEKYWTQCAANCDDVCIANMCGFSGTMIKELGPCTWCHERDFDPRRPGDEDCLNYITGVKYQCRED